MANSNVKAAVARTKSTGKISHLDLAANVVKVYLAKIGMAGKDLQAGGDVHRKTVKGIPLAGSSSVWAASLRKGAQGPTSKLQFSVVPHAKTQQGLCLKVEEALKDLPCTVKLCRAGTIQTILAYKDRDKVITAIARTVKTYKV